MGVEGPCGTGRNGAATAPKPPRRLFPVVAAATLVLAMATPAGAANPLNSSERADPATRAQQPPRPKLEFTIVPVAGGSTDIGIGGGFFTALTRTQKGHDPFLWNLEAAGFVSFASREGHLEAPYIDGYSKWTVTRFLGSPLQLEVRPSYTDEATLYYYGMGNASRATPPPGLNGTYFQYGRIHPSIVADFIFKIVDHFAGSTGIRYTGTWLDVPADSKLAADRRSGSAVVRALIGPIDQQSVALFRYGLRFDDRDNEVSPHSGTFDEVTFKWSPGGDSAFPFRYAQASAQLRAYVPFFSRRVTLAARVVGDVLFGSPPFYELSRFEDTYAVGGSNGVRGVPGQRYYGKVKVFGNVEVRARVFDFHALGKPMSIGFAAFFDGGRVWADTTPHPELDGQGLGLKYGIGGGIRFSSGSAFVLRGDVAWSPDATPLGGYFAAGEMF
jgi:hypothetical protein